MKSIIEREATFENNSDMEVKVTQKQLSRAFVKETQWSKICSTVKSTFRILSETALAQLIFFNRRRQGEVSKLTVELYSSWAGRIKAFYPEVEDCLSLTEQNLSHLFTRIEVTGKRHWGVQLMPKADMKSVIGLLINNSLRVRADIAEGNPVVFALNEGSM